MSPLAIRIFEDPGSAARITTFVTEASGKTFELSPSFPDFPAITAVARVGSLPFARLVADSLEGHRLLSPSEDFSSIAGLESRRCNRVVSGAIPACGFRRGAKMQRPGSP